MAAGGCNIVVFTTGRGTPIGSPIVPTIKVSSNTDTYVNMNDSIDLDARLLLVDKTIQRNGRRNNRFYCRVRKWREKQKQK